MRLDPNTIRENAERIYGERKQRNCSCGYEDCTAMGDRGPRPLPSDQIHALLEALVEAINDQHDEDERALQDAIDGWTK